jgi:hypothetical protein
MENRVLEVFYGADGKPYKDQERSVLFPVVGNEYQGANDFTHIRFYYQRLCGEDNTLVAVFKNAKGQLGCRPLSTSTDITRNEKYALLPISDFLTQYKGDIYIALQCYRGDANGVVWDDEQDIWVINDEVPTIRSTANIKMSVNYAPLIVGGGEEDLLTLQILLSYIAEKSNIDDVVIVLGDISQEDLSGYEVGQIFYDNDTHTYYEKTATSPYYTKALSGAGVLGAPNILCRSYDDTRTIAQLHTIYGDSAYIVLRYLGKDYLYFSKKTSSTYTCVAFDIEEQRFYKASGLSGSALPSTMLIPANKIEIASKAFLVGNYVPYNGANANVELGEHYIGAKKVHLPNSKIRTDSVDDNATLLDGKFLYDNEHTDQKEDERAISSVKYVLENHLQLLGSSGTLDDFEYAYASKPNAVIIDKDGIKTYRFVKDRGGVLYFACFDDYIDTQADGNNISFGWLLTINKSTKAYQEQEITISLYSKDQAKDKFATNLTLSMDSTTYVLTAVLKNANGETLATQSIDLPLESIVTSMTYYDTYTYGGTTYHNVLVIVLATTSVPTIVPVGSLISGLEHEALVEVSDISTPLTNDQLALLEYPNAMITYGNDVYLKAEDNGTYITLSVPYISLATNSGHEEATRKFIVVTKSSGAMALTSDTTSFYSKSQADTLLGEKADASSVVTDSDIETLGGAVTRIRKGNTWNEVAHEVDMSTTPKVVQSVADLPADNDGYLYVVLDNGYLYSWDEENQEWAQQYQYTSDLLTITEVDVDED